MVITFWEGSIPGLNVCVTLKGKYTYEEARRRVLKWIALNKEQNHLAQDAVRLDGVYPECLEIGE